MKALRGDRTALRWETSRVDRRTRLGHHVLCGPGTVATSHTEDVTLASFYSFFVLTEQDPERCET